MRLAMDGLVPVMEPGSRSSGVSPMSQSSDSLFKPDMDQCLIAERSPTSIEVQ